MSSMLDWARNEVEIACKRGNPNKKEGEFDYGCACYESALKAFESLCDDGHSGFSIKMTQYILNRLIDGKPLTPIEENDEWDPVDGFDWLHKTSVYQCRRLPSLFKYVSDDGCIEYHDNDYMYCVNLYDNNDTYSYSFAKVMYHDMFPITIPYMPVKPVAVFCDSFSVSTYNGRCAVFSMAYAEPEKNGKTTYVPIDRFFKKTEESVDTDWIEISKEEYHELKHMKNMEDDHGQD